MELNHIVNLALDITRNQVMAKYSHEHPSQKLREALIAANGGSFKINRKQNRRNGVAIFEILEELIPAIVQEGLRGDEFYMRYVDERRIAAGDAFIDNNTTGTKNADQTIEYLYEETFGVGIVINGKIGVYTLS